MGRCIAHRHTPGLRHIHRMFRHNHHHHRLYPHSPGCRTAPTGTRWGTSPKDRGLNNRKYSRLRRPIRSCLGVRNPPASAHHCRTTSRPRRRSSPRNPAQNTGLQGRHRGRSVSRFSLGRICRSCHHNHRRRRPSHRSQVRRCIDLPGCTGRRRCKYRTSRHIRRHRRTFRRNPAYRSHHTPWGRPQRDLRLRNHSSSRLVRSSHRQSRRSGFESCRCYRTTLRQRRRSSPQRSGLRTPQAPHIDRLRHTPPRPDRCRMSRHTHHRHTQRLGTGVCRYTGPPRRHQAHRSPPPLSIHPQHHTPRLSHRRSGGTLVGITSPHPTVLGQRPVHQDRGLRHLSTPHHRRATLRRQRDPMSPVQAR